MFRKKKKEPWKILNSTLPIPRSIPILTVTTTDPTATTPTTPITTTAGASAPTINQFITLSTTKAQPFKHQEPKDWITHYNVVSEANGWDNQKKLNNIPPLFQESKNAQQWYSVTFDNKPPTDYDDFCTKLKASLTPTNDKYVAYARMNLRKQGNEESVIDYYFAKMDLMKRYNPSFEEGHGVDLIVDGLLPKYQQEVFGMCDNTTELFQELRKLQTIGILDNPSEVFYVNKQDPPPYQPSFYIQHPKTCFYCSSPDHLIRDCLLREQHYAEQLNEMGHQDTMVEDSQ